MLARASRRHRPPTAPTTRAVSRWTGPVYPCRSARTNGVRSGPRTGPGRWANASPLLRTSSSNGP